MICTQYGITYSHNEEKDDDLTRFYKFSYESSYNGKSFRKYVYIQANSQKKAISNIYTLIDGWRKHSKWWHYGNIKHEFELELSYLIKVGDLYLNGFNSETGEPIFSSNKKKYSEKTANIAFDNLRELKYSAEIIKL